MNTFNKIGRWAALFLLATPLSSAYAFCGFYAGKADASLFNEASQVVIARDGNRTVISMLNDYKGPLNEFALIVPTPTVIQQGQVRVADREVFEHLDAYSAPRLAEYYDEDPCQVSFNWGDDAYLRPPVAYAPMRSMAMAAPMSEMREKALGVTVEAKFTLEEYDIVSLSAQQSDGLETWLQENGYKIPKGASAALKPYINQGMKFFIAKVNLKEQQRIGYSMLRPLQFAFESEKFMLPMRLGMLNAPPDKPQDLIVYTLTRKGRVESSNYRTANLPSNVNIPDFIKPKFQDFYKAMFDNATKKEDYRVVFNEYFWNMGWCDPCAAPPLSRDELRKSGVFWLDGANDQSFSTMQNAPNNMVRRPTPPRWNGGQQPVMLTRMHLRYTPRTFPEDLMFTQTGDTQNWQARYVIQNPYGGSVSECNERVSKMDCEAMCTERVRNVKSLLSENGLDQRMVNEQFKYKNPSQLSRDCVASCRSSKAQGMQAAVDYYTKALPQRISGEKQTLAQLTGWSMSAINAMPDAKRYDVQNISTSETPSTQTWWQKLFTN